MIVENRVARRSGLFLGPGDIFWKCYDENRPAIHTAGDLQSAGDPSPAIDDFKNYMGDVWFSFRHNFFKNYLQDLKNSLEKRATRFSTICAKNQGLNYFFDKVIKS